MKRSAYLINTSLDEAALAWALREGLIAGAALDVYEREPAVNPDLFGLDNVVLALIWLARPVRRGQPWLNLRQIMSSPCSAESLH